ncbi:hypothetical protein EHW99_2974 [Erwinia amylovora]|uniref:Uncharacterized protein n=3 Tax=Erwinia amylovora TaxID=552 RepID=A0A830ZYR5_ERWAM|nr:hypothetical protein EaACW_0609 [Erwinia amylovora ACW56400]QJQ55673.1 hypothetical protein EHX00_2974 [Erwinia amylovora]CBA19554.1 hypothetical protein predicted by Glimmer/Critica [Erwinia amylovora CFBP1430]CBX79455.1 hypothetical protein predicted by Glimmer/Critica [Erwinia amylovora ATCC BAA-2158]CCO77457.1 hypothetical protein BN432_0626 [Erwinia amylovora Ea356]CCO81242.1 hypothetical protein BN433_0637 [Erwinia amylovora Ea266]CCO85048.1 hypothetical protein BN434_0627 [Erwinia a
MAKSQCVKQASCQDNLFLFALNEIYPANNAGNPFSE